MYIFILFHIVKQYHTKSAFFSKYYHDYKCDIDFLQQFNKQEVKRLNFLREVKRLNCP